MTDLEKKAWEEFVGFTKYLINARNYEQPSERAILAAAAELRHLNAQLDMRVAQAEGYEKMVDAKDAELTHLRERCERLEKVAEDLLKWSERVTDFMEHLNKWQSAPRSPR